MVDFRKRLAKASVEKPVAPSAIYDRLDRASDKGPLRPAQEAVLAEWNQKRRADRDVIIKLHTGQGKTLIGLLVLQSKLNEGDGRALYLCPNQFLVNQTLTQAKQFGVTAVAVEEDRSLPSDFMDGKAVLVAPVQKLFNGLTKFGLGANSIKVDSLILDDAHACIDAIKEACQITLENSHPAYAEIRDLFAPDLEEQGVGTFADILQGSSGALLPVPYWSWIEHHRDVARILAKHTATKQIRFAWPLLRDGLRDCLCVLSGESLVIAPHLPPLERFGSYDGAEHRVFMSATVTDDSFLVRGLAIGEGAIREPLVYATETWSGEKMILLPSLIDPSLTDQEIVHAFAEPNAKRGFGIVVLVPSFDATKDWAAEGAVVATKEDIDSHVERLRGGQFTSTIVIANRYDGIDLPDDACRVLILDGKPFGGGLLDRYSESCRPGSEAIATRVARVIEQGLGRAVRGEKDYCVILLTGAGLVQEVRTGEGRGHYSQQTRTQIELGLEIAEFAREDIAKGELPKRALAGLIRQCLGRDEGWKGFYAERMNTLKGSAAPARMLDLFAAERLAEMALRAGDAQHAAETVQRLLDSGRVTNDADRGWYLQEIARYKYGLNKSESNSIQIAAHKLNRYLLRPREGMAVTKLAPLPQKRVAAIIRWVGCFDNHGAMMIAADAILDRLRFGVRAESFESGLDELAGALGFSGERPDKEWKEGPDNLWALKEGEYMLFECKSEVETTREAIGKAETGQMNNATAWFARTYAGAHVTRIMIMPTKKIARAAGFNEKVLILRDAGLKKLTRAVRSFFMQLKSLDLRDLDEGKVGGFLVTHRLAVPDLAKYAEEPK